MAGEGDFGTHGEDAHLCVVGGIARRQHEGGLGIIELAGDGLHLRGRKRACVQHHGQRIAAEGAVGEYIHGDITPPHLMSPYPNCHTAIGRSYPLIATSPSGTASLASSPSASQTAADTRSWELKSLFSFSSR